jgi:hypothetical protein
MSPDKMTTPADAGVNDTAMRPSMSMGETGAGAVPSGGIRNVVTRHWPLWILLVVGLILIPVIADDFGAQWDDPANAKIGAAALGAYVGDAEYFSLRHQEDHGPFFFMLSAAGSKVLGVLLPAWRSLDRRHIMNAMALLLGLCALYAICLRHFGRWAAGLATWLFATQPLILGHGFVNQKDTPFMAFFAASVALGLYAADGWTMPRGVPRAPAKEEKDVRLARRIPVGIACICSMLAVLWFVDWWGEGWTQGFALETLSRLHSGEIGGWMRALFLLVATDSYKTPLSLYQAKTTILFSWLRVLLAPMWLLIIIGVWSRASRRVGAGIRRFVSGPYPLLILAGVVLGCAISVRQYAALAGCMVCALLMFKARRRSILPLASYGVTAAVTTYATWPFLWTDPVGGFLRSLSRASGYGETTVLFRGHVYEAGGLPWDYIPGLAALELTEPALLLFLIGCAVLVWRAIRRRSNAIEVGVLLVWLVVPVVAIWLADATIYDNLRHVLFLLPTAFIIAGYGIEAILSRLSWRWAAGAMVALALLPGVLACTRLHPYESSYFNSLAGGLSGASHDYYLDPMCITYREAAGIVNDVAAPHAVVSAEGPYNNVISFARKDLMIVSSYNRNEASYFLTCKRLLFTDFSEEGFVVRREIMRDGAVLARLLERVEPE